MKRPRPNERLVNTAVRIFLVCTPLWIALALFYFGMSCATNSSCQAILPESRFRMIFVIANTIAVTSWVFMRVVRYLDFCAKVDDGTIEMPPRPPPRERIGPFASIGDALRVFNEGERLNAWYLTGYAVSFVLIECIRLADASPWLWVPAILCFGVPELYGIKVKKHTLSQTVWIFQATGSPARKAVGLGLAFWIPLVLFDAQPGVADVVVPQSLPLGGAGVAEIILATSVVVWLLAGAVIAIARTVNWSRPW